MSWAPGVPVAADEVLARHAQRSAVGRPPAVGDLPRPRPHDDHAARCARHGRDRRQGRGSPSFRRDSAVLIGLSALAVRRRATRCRCRTVAKPAAARSWSTIRSRRTRAAGRQSSNEHPSPAQSPRARNHNTKLGLIDVDIHPRPKSIGSISSRSCRSSGGTICRCSAPPPPRLREGASLSEGASRRRPAARRLDARRRHAGQRPRFHAQAASRRLWRRFRHHESARACPVRAIRIAWSVGGTVVRHQRLAARMPGTVPSRG